MTINKQTKDLDAAKLATEYLEIYEKVQEAIKLFEKGPLKDSKLKPIATALCYF